VANHKSALKRIRQSAKRTARNRHVRATMRTFIKRVRTAIEDGSAPDAQTSLREAIRKIAKAASKGVIHRNQARRRISRLSKAVNRVSTAG
jgi:small subunit ribosomal protein S20